MKFPTSRTEILDAVAMTVTDTSLDDIQKEKQVKLALIHWNHVDDKSLPDIVFDGFNAMTDTPVKHAVLAELKQGAEEFLYERAGVLNEQLYDISSQIYNIEKSGMTEVGNDSSKLMRINKLLSDKAGIVESLEGVGYTTMDRKVEITFDDSFIHVGKNADEITPFFEDKLNTMVEGFEAHGTVAVNIENDVSTHGVDNRIVTLTVNVPSRLVGDLVERVNQMVHFNPDIFQNTFDDKEDYGPAVKIETIENAIPNIRDTNDMGNRIAVREAYLESKNDNNEGVSLGM